MYNDISTNKDDQKLIDADNRFFSRTVGPRTLICEKDSLLGHMVLEKTIFQNFERSHLFGTPFIPPIFPTFNQCEEKEKCGEREISRENRVQSGGEVGYFAKRGTGDHMP